jgi:hypothetical protein
MMCSINKMHMCKLSRFYGKKNIENRLKTNQFNTPAHTNWLAFKAKKELCKKGNYFANFQSTCGIKSDIFSMFACQKSY